MIIDNCGKFSAMGIVNFIDTQQPASPQSGIKNDGHSRLHRIPLFKNFF